ncbi:alpha/beta hydrolase [Arcticibacter sp.]|jgi:S-formylglutathione hydrolase FrmB|uniref:alpha/beta hydrolase n=1 Tax=Arcticibacter sp. TaxID=1872630 RepID=UPI00388D46D4
MRICVVRKLVCFILALSFLCGSATSQELKIIGSKFLKEQDSVLIYKPQSFTTEKTYPVLYLLHGHSADFRAWSRLADLQSIADKYGFLIICPDGLKKSWYFDSPRQDSSQYESFFIKELMPEINQAYPIDRRQVFISGASMGGYGALWLFIRYPELFCSAGSTSGVVNLRHSGFKKTTIAAHLGEYSDRNAAFDDYSIVNNIHKLAGTGKAFVFDCGTDDYLYKSNKSLRDKCDSLKLSATYIAQPGAHTGRYWSATLLQHMHFFANQIKHTVE